MNLARVTRESVRHAPAVAHAAAAAADAESLALLLGAEGEADGPAFPAALQAALADGDGTAEALDVTDGTDGAVDDDDDASSENDTGISLDAALAAALGLTLPTAPEPAAHAGMAGGAGAVLDAPVAGVSADAGAATKGQAGPSVDVTTATTVATKAVTTSPDPGASPKATTAAVDASTDDATIRPTLDANERRATAPTDASVPSSAASAPTTGSPAARAAATAASAEIVSGRPTPQGAPDGTSAAGHHGIADAGSVAGSIPFSSGGGAQSSLDGGSADPQVFALVEKPTSTPSTTTAPGIEGEKIHATTASTSGAADATPTPPPAITSSAAPSETVSRAQHVVQHPTTIEGRWGERIADALRLSSVRGGGEIRLQLDPEGLGHIDVRLHLQPDGVRAVIVAEHESTRALITSQQQVLQDAFSRSDLRLSGFSVDVGSGGGAASFGRDGDADAGRGGTAPAASTAPVTTRSAGASDGLDSTPTANGRVNVRV